MVAGVRQVRLRARVEPELAGQLAELREIQVELRDAQGQRVVLPPGRIVSLDRAKAGGLGRLLVEVDVCLSLPEPQEDQDRRRDQRERAIERSRHENDPRITEGMRLSWERRCGVRPTAGRNREMLALSDGGWSHVQIAAAFGISAQRVCQIVGELRGTRQAQPSRNPGRDGEVVRLRAEGLLPMEIASRVGLSRHLVNQILYRERRRKEAKEVECPAE